jgi:hypothetical protein
MSKQITKWNDVLPGDIISFRYKPTDKSKPTRTHSIMVLNSKYPKTLKDGTQKFYLNGLKLEGSNISIFTSKEETWDFLRELGWIFARNLDNEIYRIRIRTDYIGPYGATKKLYDKLKISRVGRKAEFRTYSHANVIKNAVFHEPIKLPSKRMVMLQEQLDAEVSGESSWREYLHTRNIDEEEYED